MDAYNKELAYLGSPSWFNTDWLFAECYLYRLVIHLAAGRIHISLSRHDVVVSTRYLQYRSSGRNMMSFIVKRSRALDTHEKLSLN